MKVRADDLLVADIEIMHHYSPSPRWLAVPDIGFPKISRLVRMCFIQSIFGIGRSQHVARGTANMVLRRNSLSPRAHQRGHGFRPDGELVADETTHRRIVMCLSLISRVIGLTGRINPNPVQKNSSLPKDFLDPSVAG
jgi:hypothetical protein